MENIDYEKRDFNTRFLCRKFFDSRIDYPFEDCVSIHPEQVEDLKKSIEIIKNDEYFKSDFKKGILYVTATGFWNDLYLLKKHEEKKTLIENSLKKQQTDFDNDPDKEDSDFYRFDKMKRFRQQNLNDIDNIIELTKEFRDLINKAMPELEKEFAQRLKEHNDFQVSEAAKDKARDEERKRLRNERKINIPRLQTNLIPDQRGQLFELLKSGEFIPNDTDPDCFNWAIGATDEKETKQPGQWQSIEWKEAKTGLRELLTPILGTITNEHCRQIEQLFTKNRDPFKMLKPKRDEYSARYTDIQNILLMLKI
jgi:hypothetical protein